VSEIVPDTFFAAPAVSVAICLHNSSRFIDDALESVFSQTWQDFEVILVDDGSTDGCADAIEDRWRDARVRLIRQPHLGLGRARAVSVTSARGEFVAFLDHDDLWLPEKLETQIMTARRQPEAALIFSDCLLIDARGVTIGRLSDRFDYGSIDLAPGRAFRELLVRGCFIDVSTVLVRAAVFRRVGPFAAKYRYVEDYDMWLRIARGYRLFCVTTPLAKRRIHAAQFTQRFPEVALAEQTSLLRSLLVRPSYPADVKVAVGEYLLGQHRQCCRSLVKQGRWMAAVAALAGMLRYPARLTDYCANRLARMPVLQIMWRLTRGAAHPHGAIPETRVATGAFRDHTDRPGDIWVDGTSLADAQAGYFNLVVELIRELLVRTDRNISEAPPQTAEP
jgi:glycosyltransferase involved in cell wall biosynthesis